MLSFEEWPWNEYPYYFHGPTYLMSQSSILPLLAASQSTPMMPFEDIYLTGLCAEKAGIRHNLPQNSFIR